MRTASALLCAAAAGAAVTTPAAAALPPTRAIALSGQSSANYGVLNQVHISFSSPTINHQGVVGFTGTTGINVNQNGVNNVFTWHNEQGALIARVGQPLANHPTYTYNRLGTPIVAENGEVAFWAEYRANDSAMIAGSPGNLRLLALESADSTPNATWLSDVGQFDTVMMSRSGFVGLGAVPLSNRWFYSGTSNGLSLVLQDGTQLPGLPPGNVIRGMGFSRMDNAGNITALGHINNDSSRRALVSAGPGGLHTVWAPGLPVASIPNATFQGGVSPPNVNGDGVYGVRAGYSVGAGPLTGGAFVGAAGDLQLVLSDGDSAPGLPGRTVSNVDAPVINHSGRFLIPGHVHTNPNGPFHSTLWTGSLDAGLSVLVTAGDSIDNLEPGWTYADLNTGGADVLLFNNRDQAAFLGMVRFNNGPITQALMAATPQGELLAVAIRGMAFEVAPGDSRIVSDIFIYGSNTSGPTVGLGGDDGFGTSFNDRGELAYSLNFADGTRGVFVTMIPTPGAAALLAFAGIFASRRRR